MIDIPKEFWTFAREVGLCVHLGYRGDDIFRAGARRLDQPTLQAVIGFLRALVRSPARDEEIRALWAKSETCMPDRSARARPFTNDIIDMLEHPRPPISPEN